MTAASSSATPFPKGSASSSPANEPNSPIHPMPSNVTPMLATGRSPPAPTRYQRKRHGHRQDEHQR